MKVKNLLNVMAIKCPSCGDTVFSRTRHDCRRCTCGEVYIDGGFDYNRVGFHTQKPELFQIEVRQTKKQLYNDWNCKKDEFGLILDLLHNCSS